MRITPLLMTFAVSFMLAVLPAKAADKLTVYLDWFVNPDHAPLVIAETQGYFKKYDLEVTIVPPSDPSAPPRLIAAGQEHERPLVDVELKTLKSHGQPRGQLQEGKEDGA